jgi:hypothetical protein
VAGHHTGLLQDADVVREQVRRHREQLLQLVGEASPSSTSTIANLPGRPTGQRTIGHSGEVAEQLQAALNSRVLIEQAKGMLAQQGGIAIGTAFTVLRQYARRNNQRITDAARAVVDASLTLDAMGGPDSTRSPR